MYYTGIENIIRSKPTVKKLPENKSISITAARRKRGNKMDEVKMIVSCVVIKENRKIVRVSFLRGSDYADGILPDGILEKYQGFTPEEAQKLENYMRANRKSILEQAKQIDPLRNWLGEWKK